MDLWCEFCKNKCCIYLPHASQTERKGHKDRRASARRTGLRNLGFVQKAEMVNVHLAVHNMKAQWQSTRLQNDRSGSIPEHEAKECTASGTKNNLLFCKMNTYEGRKPT